jgi:hypothetical protein
MELPVELRGKMFLIRGDVPNVKFLRQKKVFLNGWMIERAFCFLFFSFMRGKYGAR